VGTVIWKGGAPPIAQVDTVTVVGTVEADDIFILTIGYKSVSTVGGSTNATTVANTVAVALNALDSSEYPEFAEITWTDSGAVITATATTPGKPFTLTASSTEANGNAADDQTFTRAASVTSSGPNDWSVAANWSTAAVPANTDDVVVEDSNVDILYGLDQTGILLSSLTFKSTYSGYTGLPATNHAGGYPEYRPTSLVIGANTVSIGDGEGRGSGRIKLDLDGQVSAITVKGTGQPIDTGLKALMITGTAVNSTADISAGSVALSPFASQTCVLTTLDILHQGNVVGDVDLYIGSGANAITMYQRGGTILAEVGPTTALYMEAGVTTVMSGAATTYQIDGGILNWRGADTLTTVNVGGTATVNRTPSGTTSTWTNCNLYAGGAINDPAGELTITNGVDLQRCGLMDVTLDLGKHLTVTKSAI
jgi:trimeric autotransporter adhesin